MLSFLDPVLTGRPEVTRQNDNTCVIVLGLFRPSVGVRRPVGRLRGRDLREQRRQHRRARGGDPQSPPHGRWQGSHRGARRRDHVPRGPSALCRLRVFVPAFVPALCRLRLRMACARLSVREAEPSRVVVAASRASARSFRFFPVSLRLVFFFTLRPRGFYFSFVFLRADGSQTLTSFRAARCRDVP